MKKQSIANRKSLDRLAKKDPAKYEEKKRRNRFFSARSFIRLHATTSELKELLEIIQEKLKNS